MSDRFLVGVLREAFRNLHHFRSVYESDGIDVITGPQGFEICLWDLEYLFDRAREVLPLRQRQAIEWFLVQNIKESDVAEMMGISANNPIGTYATAGINNLVNMIESGEFPSFGFEYERQEIERMIA